MYMEYLQPVSKCRDEILKVKTDQICVPCVKTEKIILVTDNLNTHTTALLYKAFKPE